MKKIAIYMLFLANLTRASLAPLDVASQILPTITVASFINSSCNKLYANYMLEALASLQTELNEDQLKVARLYMLMVKLINDLQIVIAKMEENNFNPDIIPVLRKPQQLATNVKMDIINANPTDVNPVMSLLDISKLIPITTLDLNGQIATILTYANYFSATDNELYAKEMQNTLLEAAQVLNKEKLEQAKIYMLMVKLVNDLQLRIVDAERYQFTVTQFALLRTPLARYGECLDKLAPVQEGLYSTALPPI